MENFSLKFRNSLLENKYSDFKWKFNKKPAIYLLFFNFYFALSISIYAISQQMFQIVFYNIALFGFTATFFYLSIKASPHKSLQVIYIIIATIIPYQVEVYFIITEMQSRNAGYSEWLMTGALIQTYYSFYAKFRISWLIVISCKFVGPIYMVYLNLVEKFGVNQNLVMLFILMVIGSIGDYHQDRNDRDSFLSSYNSTKKNDFYKNLIELIPDQVLIWKEESFIFANKSAFVLFNQSTLEGLHEILLDNIEIIEYNDLMESNEQKKNLFSLKLIETLKGESSDIESSFNLPIFTANVKSENENGPFACEYDLKMKKIFWENDEAVLVLMSKVDEKNVNARLEYVNSFLNYVLGNVSHEIATPFNILLGLIETTIPQIKNKEVVKDLKIARNMGEILINMFHTMIDLFNIRKGSLLLNLEVINVHQEIKEISELFSEILFKKNVEVFFNGNLPLISTDRRRFRQIIIGILNFSLKHIEKADIQINLMKSTKDLFEISFESQFSKHSTNENLENCFPSSLKDMMMKKTKSYCNIAKKGSANTPLSESLNVIDSGMNISMLDYLVLCLSSGEVEHLKIDHKLFSHYVCSFKIKDIRNSMIIKLKDLILDHNLFIVNYFKDGENVNESDSYECTPIHDETNLMFSTYDNTHINEFGNYTQVFKMMPSNFEHENHLVLKKSNSQNQDSSPLIQKSSILRSSFSRIREDVKELNVLCPCQKKHFILNVDDNFLNLMVITKYCRDFAFEVVEAKNGLEAINEVENLLQKEKVAFDLIFMDCDMPILDGFEASHRINEFYLERKMFQPGIVAITANVVNEEIRMKIKKSGMKELVLKPLSIDKFKEILFRYLNMKTK